MHTHHHNSCGFCEEGLPEQHLCCDMPELYHEDERIARWAAAVWAGGKPLMTARGYRLDLRYVEPWNEGVLG